jgi:hypothetical protein
MNDALLALKAVVGTITLNDNQFKRADINNDGSVDIKDVMQVLMKIVTSDS